MARRPPNDLGHDARPRFFPVADGVPRAHGLEDRGGVGVRVLAGSLGGMQKEAVVQSSSGLAWRLASDEGPYLDGYDEAPFPLAHMTTGMVAAYANELVALAAQRDVDLGDWQLTLHNRYTMRGSALAGTMVGGALPPDLELEADADVAPGLLRGLVADAASASPANGLVRAELISLFTLTANGRQVSTDAVEQLDRLPEEDPARVFDNLAPADRPEVLHPLVELRTPADEVDGAGGVSSSYAETQDRTLHVRGVCTVRHDGVKQIDQHLHSPIGSTFRFLSEEAPANGGEGRAPDALAYVAAGLAFCFMTQFGRFAKIARKPLDAYRVVQDLYTSPGGATGGTGRPATADPVETHVFIDTPEGADFARQVLDMSERTCFLHALCRTVLQPRVRVATSS